MQNAECRMQNAGRGRRDREGPARQARDCDTGKAALRKGTPNLKTKFPKGELRKKGLARQAASRGQQRGCRKKKLFWLIVGRRYSMTGNAGLASDSSETDVCLQQCLGV